jgi:hypothetical protein
MGRDRCIFCDRFIFDGEDVTRPPSLGLTVHRHCYRREVGLEEMERPHPGWKDSEDPEDSEDSEEPRW